MRVLFFAQIKDAAGCASVHLEVPAAIKAEALWGELLKRFPALEKHRRTVRLARNSEYASAETEFTNGDEVALIPPVSGG